MKIAILICLVASYVCVAQAFLKCNKCEGEPDGDCANGVASAMVQVECVEREGLRATCFNADFVINGIRSYSRDCTDMRFCKIMSWLEALAHFGNTTMQVFSCSQCYTDMCN